MREMTKIQAVRALMRKRGGKSTPIVFWAIVLIGCLTVIVYLIFKPGPQPPAISGPQTSGTEPGVPTVDPAIVRREFYAEHVIPAIEVANKANQEAAERCLTRIAESFDSYRAGVTPFAEDMTSFGTKFGVLRRMPSDWWHERQDVQQFVAGKLEKHVFSEEILRKDIEASLAKFRQDIQSNNTQMLTQIKANTTGTQMPNLQQLNASEFFTDVIAKVESYAADSATDSVTDLILTEAASGAGGLAAQQIIVAVIVRLGASAGGATAGSAAVGGGGGSLGGPVGAGVGIAGGLIVGLVIDYWMTERAKEALSRDLNKLLNEIEGAVMEGATLETEEGPQKKVGLKESLEATSASLDKAYRQILHTRIVGADA